MRLTEPSGAKQEMAPKLRVHRRESLPAKLSRPRLAAVYARTRLCELLDEGLEAPAVWIEAQPGAGKTTLVAQWLDQRRRSCLWYQVDAGDADPATLFRYLVQAARHIAPHHRQALPYLTPEYLLDVETFSRRFFEELFRRMPQGGVLVLDNVQDAGVDGALHDILRIAIEAVPPHARMLCISRVPPPVALARLRANGQLALIESSHIRLSPQEAQGIAALRGQDDPVVVAALYALTHGWTAGLVLMLESNARDADTRDSQVLFNYFAAEVLRGMDETKRQTLLKSSLLPRMRVADVVVLTGNVEAGKLLAELQLRNYFTYRLSPREPVYEYHPLFREFLCARLHETCDDVELARLRSQAAALLDDAGQIEEAAALWIAVSDWQSLVPHIMKHAPRLLAEGRMHLAENWLGALPARVTEAQPWLLYWKGACLRALNPLQARAQFERAYELFEAAGELTGQYETWASIVDTFHFQWDDFEPLDRWAAAMDRLVAAHPRFPSPRIEVRVAASMLNALTYRQLSHPDATRWAAKVEAFVLGDNDLALRVMLGNALAFYYLWCGNFPKLAVLIDALRLSSKLLETCDPLTRQLWHVIDAISAAVLADWPACQRAIADGIANADQSGMHLLDLILLGQGIFGGVSLGDLAKAQEWLDRMSRINRQSSGHEAYFYFQAASVACGQADMNKAVELGWHAVRITGEIGWTYAHSMSLIELANYYFDSGRHEDADDCLARGMALAEGAMLEFMACMSGARFAFERGFEERGAALLRQGLAQGERWCIANMPCWKDGQMSQLLARALEHGVETEYALWLIRRRRLDPPKDSPVPEAWPFVLKLYTLGRFSAVVEDKPLQFSGKSQKKPLEMLKALVALGSRDVSEATLAAALWPEADGDDALQALATTLHRLRRLIGEDCIERRGGRLSLDRRFVWVDVWAFEVCLAELEACGRQNRRDELAALAARLFTLYRGAFLDDEVDAPWALNQRERLRVRFLRQLEAVARLLSPEHPDEAAKCYENAIEIEPLGEGLYRGLMRVHLQSEHRAEALAVYARCRKMLGAQLGIQPSPETEALHRQIRGVKSPRS